MRRVISILVLLTLVSASLAATNINQVDSKWSDLITNDTTMWTSLTAWNTFNATGNGKQLLIINATAKTTNPFNLTIHSGPFLQGALGGLKYNIKVNETLVIGPLETSRFMQANGTILIEMNRTTNLGRAFVVGVP